jgi:hypothetical protein
MQSGADFQREGAWGEAGFEVYCIITVNVLNVVREQTICIYYLVPKSVIAQLIPQPLHPPPSSNVHY